VSVARSREAAPTVGRKADHIRINVDEDVSAKGITTGFEEYRFIPRALPEIDLDEVDLSQEFFRHKLGAPLFISCMTGGVPEAERINRTLAEVAQEYRLAIGLGSGRVLLEHPEVLSSFNVRPHAPDVPILANLGAVQLNRGVGGNECRRLIDLIDADILVLHLNALQEALQPEGDTCFGGLLDQIAHLCDSIDVPVIVKEVGWGIAPDMVTLLLDAGVSAVDVAGAGGTSWSEVERHRMQDPVRRRMAAAFAGWGLPTAEAVRGALVAAAPYPRARVLASGGISDGMDAAKALALGADLVGIAGPFLRAAVEGRDAARDLAEEVLEVLRTIMFCIGARTVADLRRSPRLASSRRDRVETGAVSLHYTTGDRGEFVDITDDVAAMVERSGVRNGLVHVCSYHTTAAIRINENEPLLVGDFRRMLDRLIPPGSYDHDDLARRHDVPPDEPRNGHSHCQHLLLSSSESVPVRDRTLLLGPWQRILLIELDSPRQRQVTVQVVGT
jgi:isopentenyl-diphosphate delta-isomerase